MKPLPVILVLVLSPVVGALGRETPPVIDDSLDKVLKTDSYEFAERLGDSSEHGQNEAARLEANARRIRTESRIAARSVRRVMILAMWRQALNRWDDLELEIVHLRSGGGTMWLHMMCRNDAHIEQFLEGVAPNLPLEPADPQPAVADRIDRLLTEATQRLEKAREIARQFGMDDRQRADGIRRRLGEAHQELKAAFLHSGDVETTEKLLQQCIDSSLTWKTLDEMDDE